MKMSATVSPEIGSQIELSQYTLNYHDQGEG